MANSKISALTSATTPLAGTETLPIVQSSATTKVTVANLTAGRAVSASSLTVSSGDLNFSSTGQRITGDFSNGTVANRLEFQSNSVNGNTAVGIIPNGTATTAVFDIFNNSNTTNSGRGRFIISAASVDIQSTITGTGTYLPITFQTSGSEKVRIDTSGNFGIGVTPAVKLDVLGTVQAAAAATQDAVRLAGRAGGTGTFAVTLTPTTLTASRTLTLPDATTTVVGTDATQTLTNKTISSGTLTGTLTAGGGVGTSGQFLQSTATGVQWAAATGVLAQNTQVFTSGTAATYTAPANTQWVKVTVVGAGATGAGTTVARATGGGAGGVAIKWLAITAGQTLIYTVGATGAALFPGGASSVVSGTATITTITANGGLGATTTAYASSYTAGPVGGTAIGGDVNIQGGSGGGSYGSSTSSATNVSGKGGDCPGFGVGGGVVANTVTNGLPGTGYGSGGSGGIGSSGGTGASGVIIFEAF